MWMRINYFLCTDYATRRADSAEFAAARKELLRLANEYYEARGAITGVMDSRSRSACIYQYRMAFGEYECSYFSWGAGCTWGNRNCSSRCQLYPKNQKFFAAMEKYLAQKKIIDEFWNVRMRERVNAKQK